MNTGFYTNPIFLEHDTGSHPENANRLRAISDRLESEGMLEKLKPQSGRPATTEELKMLHTDKLISEVEAASESGARNLHTPDCVISPQTYNAALYAVGSVLDGVVEVAERRFDNAFCAVRPPGHHAENDYAMGFCFFNNIALAAEFLSSELGFKRGKGAGSGYTLNVPVLPGMGDEEYLQTFYDQVQPKLEEYRPDFILVSAGFDAHRDDPLAALNLTEQTFSKLTFELKQLAERHAGGRIMSMLEGGYDLNALSSSVREHLTILQSED